MLSNSSSGWKLAYPGRSVQTKNVSPAAESRMSRRSRSFRLHESDLDGLGGRGRSSLLAVEDERLVVVVRDDAFSY